MTVIEVLARPLTPFSAHSSPPCRRTISRATCIQSYFSEACGASAKGCHGWSQVVGQFAKHVLATLRCIGHERRDAKCELSPIAGVLLLKSLRFQHALLISVSLHRIRRRARATDLPDPLTIRMPASAVGTSPYWRP